MQHCMRPKCQDVQCKAKIDDCYSGYLINNYSMSTRIGYEMVNSQQLRLHCNAWHLTGCGDADPHNSLKSAYSA